ncbi:hypothetical protein [Spartinivicinus poritis]|uniref:Uncharacterized protein n=1 Tax=Spartinivicinus poritis TaxID=2994640 RepID=A0ABT5U775_9GAMM|nr:hypothetical protein [Spartinivicinus sp. A2-2]MDE1462167.1 hypothetical protein [Spartinivicinus sp. A2-2]
MSNEQDSTKSATELIQPSINQSVAAAVQSATDLLKNISTIESTVIGVASAKWLAEPLNPAYQDIINNAKDNIEFAVKNLKDVGEAGASVISNLQPK